MLQASCPVPDSTGRELPSFGAGSDFLLLHCVTRGATDPLGYSDGPQGCQGGLALKHADVSLQVPRAAVPARLKRRHPFPVTPESPQAWNCVQIRGIGAIKHFN